MAAINGKFVPLSFFEIEELKWYTTEIKNGENIAAATKKLSTVQTYVHVMDRLRTYLNLHFTMHVIKRHGNWYIRIIHP